MLNRAETTDVGYFSVVRWIRNNDRSLLTFQQRGIRIFIQRICAKYPMLSQQPAIIRSCNAPVLRYRLNDSVRRVRFTLSSAIEAFDSQIDFAHLEAGKLDTEVQGHFREVLEVLSQQAVIPFRDLAQTIVTDDERASLSFGQMLEGNGGEHAQAQELAGLQARMTREEFRAATQE
jgi:hypothetical protein